MDPTMDYETMIIEYEYLYDEDEEEENLEDDAEVKVYPIAEVDLDAGEDAEEEEERAPHGLLTMMLMNLGKGETEESVNEEPDSEKEEDDMSEDEDEEYDEVIDGEINEDEVVDDEVAEDEVIDEVTKDEVDEDEVTDEVDEAVPKPVYLTSVEEEEVIEDGPNGRRVVKSRKRGRGPRPVAHGLLEMMLSEGFDLGELFKNRPRKRKVKRKIQRPRPQSRNFETAGNSYSRRRHRGQPQSQNRRKRLLRPQDFAQERISRVPSRQQQSQLKFPKAYTTTIVHDSPKRNTVIPSAYLEDPFNKVSFPSTANTVRSAPSTVNIVRPIHASAHSQGPFTVPTSIIGQLIFHSQSNQKPSNQSQQVTFPNPTTPGRLQSRDQVRQHRAITQHQNQLRLQQQQRRQQRQQQQQQQHQQQLRQVRKAQASRRPRQNNKSNANSNRNRRPNNKNRNNRGPNRAVRRPQRQQQAGYFLAFMTTDESMIL